MRLRQQDDSDAPDRGAPATFTLETPSSRHQHTGAQIWLDLGSVKNLAELTVNGKPLGILWKPPFRANVTGALKAGANTVEISVTNLWVNRLIGDQQPGATQYTYTAMKFYRADSPLLPSGLIGPVTVLRRAVTKP